MTNVLFLQGPLGTFFNQLAAYFSEQNIGTYKINFNGGDEFFSSADRVLNFTGKDVTWGQYLQDFIAQHHIDAIIVYGDCRFYHQVAGNICKGNGIDFWCFEEGYLRAGFITLELGGCNANSTLKYSPSLLHKVEAKAVQSEHFVGATFFKRMSFAIRYYWALQLNNNYPNYCHHRPWEWWQEGVFWIKNFVQKFKSKFLDPKIQRKLITDFDKQLFLLPLQIEVDFQLRQHSRFNNIEEVIEHTVFSFAHNAKSNDALLIKHHPQGRGFNHYGSFIAKIINKYGLQGRVFYGHDFCLPTLYKHVKGVVTVNSTVGISALIHHLPVKVLGEALYDIEGICYQKSLDEFWQAKFAMDKKLFAQFHTYLQQETQLSGDFYKDTGPLIASSYKKITEHTEQLKLLKAG